MALLFLGVSGFGPCERLTARHKSSGPSTGNQLPGAPQSRLSPAEAEAAVQAGMSEYAKGPTKDCQKVIKSLVSGLPSAVTSENEAAFYALADCAKAERRWSLMREATVRLMRGDRSFPHPAMLPTADIGLGNYDKAEKDLAELVPQHPKDPELAFARGLIPCKRMEWQGCLKGMDAALQIERPEKIANAKTFEGNADVHRADSFMHLGQLEVAAKTIDLADKLGADPHDVAGIRKDLVPAKASHVVIDEFHQPETPIGIYHLYGKVKDAGVPVQVWIYNIGPKDRVFRVESEIVGVSDRMTTNVTVLKGGFETVPMVPPLKTAFNASSQRSDLPTQLNVKVIALDPGGEKVVDDMTYPIKVLPRDSLLLALRIDEDAVKPIDEYIGAWVTPNARAVDQFLQAAKKRAPEATFAGTQASTLPQVQALYEELQARGVSYVMDPEAASDTGFAQRTRLPSDVLTTNNAQCLEGAILFATLMEAIGLDPLVIRIPGHAFVGWHAAHDPVPDGTRLYVETTMVHTAKYPDAVKYAKVEVDRETAEAHFTEGISRFIEIKTLREKGVTPQPWE